MVRGEGVGAVREGFQEEEKIQKSEPAVSKLVFGPQEGAELDSCTCLKLFFYCFDAL